ncbi:MAG: hypothetical protein HPY66_2176 [Firmicutes bacterium]|nr:hypothetical protein [Bacillota bacterium]
MKKLNGALPVIGCRKEILCPAFRVYIREKGYNDRQKGKEGMDG